MPDTSYTGDHEGVHVIKRGETLSSIARRYGFRHWQPIWIYNSKIYPVLKHPDRIPAGGRLLLPRSRTGYEKLITKLKQLRYQIGGKADCVLHELEGSYNRHMAHRVLYDFLGDAATVLVMAGFKAARAARAARAALTTTGRAVPAAKYLARQEAKKMSKYLTSELGEKTGDLAFDALGGNRNPIAKGTYQSYKTVKKGARAIRGVSLQHGRSFADIGEILLDYAKVSNVADWLMKYALGIGSTKETYGEMKATTRMNASAWSRDLERRIDHYKKERDTVYSK